MVGMVLLVMLVVRVAAAAQARAVMAEADVALPRSHG
jgi:hypothetical protein